MKKILILVLLINCKRYKDKDFRNNKLKIINKNNVSGKKKIKQKNKKGTVFITGTDSGIGKATVEEFAQKGWKVAAGVYDEKSLDIFKKYKNVKTYLLDVSDELSIEETSNQAIEDFGKIDILIKR